MSKHPEIHYNYFKGDREKVIKTLGKELIEFFKKMVLIRNFEIRAEASYQHGKIGGFFHAYMGQEAIQTAAVAAGSLDFWYTTTYRCHALSLLLGTTPDAAMAELFGRSTGNAMGRGGSMHLYADRMLGGFGIVGGHLPIATGAAFTIKYKKEDALSLCFLGDGAVAQGAFHESLNLASLWDLPCIYVIENNQWGMGTAVERAICVQPIAEKMALSYNMKGYSVNGMDFFDCYACFEEIYRDVKKTHRPVLIEAVTERFRGHSISDPGLYRTKEELEEAKQRDPIHLMFEVLKERKMLSEEDFDKIDKEQKEIVKAAIKYADESPWPDLITLEEDVFAP